MFIGPFDLRKFIFYFGFEQDDAIAEFVVQTYFADTCNKEIAGEDARMS